MIQIRFPIFILAALLALGAGRAWAGAPTDQLRGSINKVIKSLEDPEYKGDAKVKERRAVIRKIANDIFDFAETARRSLARHWQARTDREREEFIQLFSDLLERAYFSKIDVYGGERISYLGELVDGDVATVRTRIVTRQGSEIPIDYRMLRRGERWLVYDVSIEGVSLVSNYRTQFNKIIQTSSYQELVRKMRVKQGALMGEETKSKGTVKKKTEVKTQ